uniref:Uncharacterized protein n=1 Tax=Knipowitschia caucasica TaxID=637954 RepID=A0AAV2KWW7_KNICA
MSTVMREPRTSQWILPLPRTPPLHVSCYAGAKHLTMDPPTPAHTSPACLRCYEERGPRSTADSSGGYYYGPAHMSAEVSGDVWATLLVASEVAPASPEPALEVCAALWERWWPLRSHKPAQTNNPELLAVSGAAGSKAPVSPETAAGMCGGP